MWRGMGEAWTAVSYLICGIAVWGGLGWLLDRALHTTPVLFVIGALLGKAGGVYLVYIRAMGSQGGPSRAP
jgi:F0F1-type ATP synthase assembly protein I